MLNKKQIVSVSVVVLAVVAVLIFVSGKAGGRDNPKASESPSQKSASSQKATDNSNHKSTKSQSTMQNNKSDSTDSTTSTAQAYVPKIDGVTIEVSQEGSGDKAVKSGDTISVHYTGTLENGTVFDSSIPRKQPFSFRIGQGMVIQGWDQGLIGMKVGEKRKLTISPEMGYGDQANGSIPANSVLIFDVELLGIK